MGLSNRHGMMSCSSISSFFFSTLRLLLCYWNNYICAVEAIRSTSLLNKEHLHTAAACFFLNIKQDLKPRDETPGTTGRGPRLVLDQREDSFYSLIIYGDVAEQVGHGFSVMDAADGFSQNHTDVHCLNLGTLELLDLVGDRVRHHHLCDEAELRLRPQS